MAGISDHDLQSGAEDELARYHPVSKLAVAGFAIGLLAAFAIAVPLLWLLAFLGAWVSIAALRRIRADATLSGSGVARAGIFLSLMFGAAVPAQMLATRWWLDQQAQQFAAQWFDYLQANKPHLALQLGTDPTSRRDLSNDFGIWQHYLSDRDSRLELEYTVTQPVVRALLELGPKAQVRYYTTKQLEQQPTKDLISLLFAVTYESGGRKTFLVQLDLERTKNPLTGTNQWQITRYSGPVSPAQEVN